MVYINTTGKHNEVWLDKPYATITVECPDCPSTEDAYNSGWTDGSEDGYHKGYQSGRTDGYDDGWGPGYESGFTDGLEACSGETIHNQTKSFNILDTGGDLKVKYEYGAYQFENITEDIRPNSGYTGLERVGLYMYIYPGEALQDGFNSGYTSGYTDGLNACSGGSCEGIWEAGYDSGFTDGVNSVECSGYTQEDLDAAFQSGITYQKSLLTSTAITENGRYTSQNGFDDVTVSVDCQSEGNNILDMTYVTSANNQTINLFMGDAQYTNSYFIAFFSAITYMEIDGIPVLTDPNNIVYDTTDGRFGLYTHTFASAGNHTVRFMMSRSFSASTQTGTKYPAFELTDLIFCSNSQDKCPVINANIGAGYEVLKTGVFQGNKTLTAATIPASVTGITWVTFENSTIKQLTCYGTTPPTLGSNVFAGVTTLEHIYVPASAVEDYKAATNWSNYASIISAIQ